MTTQRIVFGEIYACPQCGQLTPALYPLGVTFNGMFQGRRVCVTCLNRIGASPWNALLVAAGFEPMSDSDESGEVQGD